MPFAPSRSSLSAAARRLVDAASALLLVAVLVVTLLQVGARYVFNWPMPWSEELTRLIFVWLVMIAAVGSAHMRIEFFAQRMPETRGASSPSPWHCSALRCWRSWPGSRWG